jgi:histidine decarboxylase
MTMAAHEGGTLFALAPELVEEQFALDENGKTDTEREAALEALHEYLVYYQERFLGYQVNQDLNDLESELGRFLNVHTNNIGDPYTDSNLRTHTKPLERAVLAYYAKLWGIEPHKVVNEKPREVDPESAWGYVLSMGSSEGNVYGLLNARDYLSGKFLMMEPTKEGAVPRMFLAQAEVPPESNAYKPVIFFSADTHYSVAKAAHTLAIPTFGEVGNRDYANDCPLLPEHHLPATRPWPLEVPSNDDGSIDVEKLKLLVEFFVDKGHPILLVLNLGSTYKGAYDRVDDVVKQLGPTLKKLEQREVHYDPEHPEKVDKRDGYWIHIDGALGATYLPFLRKAQEASLIGLEWKVPPFDFSIKEVSSIVTSGHKYPGVPWACGIYMTRSRLQLRPPPSPTISARPTRPLADRVTHSPRSCCGTSSRSTPTRSKST